MKSLELRHLADMRKEKLRHLAEMKVRAFLYLSSSFIQALLTITALTLNTRNSLLLPMLIDRMLHISYINTMT